MKTPEFLFWFRGSVSDQLAKAIPSFKLQLPICESFPGASAEHVSVPAASTCRLRSTVPLTSGAENSDLLGWGHGWQGP